MFVFANKEVLYFLLFLPIILFMSLFFVSLTRKLFSKAFQPELLNKLTSSVSYAKRKWKIVLEVLVLAFLILSYARLQMGQGERKVKNEGIEIMLAFDVSKSMAATDTKPSRLDYAKAQAQSLLSQMKGHKVGLIIFAGNSVLVSPLTPDYSAIRMYIDSINTDSVSAQGTDYERLLNSSQSAFEGGGVATDDTTKVTRILLLLSDGEDHAGGAVDLAEKLKEQGIRVFSLGIGTKEGGKIPTYDKFGYLQGYKKDKNGKEVISHTKTDVLKNLAQAGGGGFYQAAYGTDHIKNIVADIDKLEKTEFESKMMASYKEYFQYFLFSALLLAFLEIFMSERASKRKLWKGRFEGDYKK